MTNQKHLKARVRDRMTKTGERYAAARANVVEADQRGDATPPAGPAAVHLPGIHPETTAVRILATAAGSVHATTGEPVSEELILVVAGGVGAGAFAFHYPQFSSLYLAGRHRFDDSAGFVADALARLGVGTETRETTSTTAARRNLAAALEHGPAIAWLDLVELGTRGVPEQWSGGGYHVVTVYELDPDDGAATIGDLRRAPERIDAERFGRARGRIARDKTRVLGIAGRTGSLDLDRAIAAGLAACVDGLRNPRSGSFGLGSWATLARRMGAASGKDAWATAFPRGRRLFAALRSIYEYVETYSTGGGLMRPMFAAGLGEAATVLGDDRLAGVGDRYAAIGRDWTELARAALPGSVPLFAATRANLDERAARFRAGASPAEMRALVGDQDHLGDPAADAFPLSEADAADLRADLAGRLERIVEAETAALAELESMVAR